LDLLENKKMTRTEHLNWCKDRAIQEFDFYAKEGFGRALNNGLASMASDISKHPETKSAALQSLCMMQAMIIKDRQGFINFINGFN
jgi:hypothetical protein